MHSQGLAPTTVESVAHDENAVPAADGVGGAVAALTTLLATGAGLGPGLRSTLHRAIEELRERRDMAQASPDPQPLAGAHHEVVTHEHALLDAMDTGVLVRNATGRVIYANPAALRIFRVDSGELSRLEAAGFPGWRFSDNDGNMLSPRNFPGLRALANGHAVEAELICFWLPKADAPLWMQVSATPLRRPGEARPYGVVSTFNDVTEVKRTQELLEQTQALGHIGGFELLFGRDEPVWTSGMYRLFDLSPEFPVTLERVLSLFAPRSRERAQRDLREVMAGQQGKRQEYEIVTALGRRRWISAVSRPLVRGNDIYGLIGTCQDITERRQMELELRRKAVTDPVTGLANRESILDELNRQIGEARNADGPALLYIDLDRFKVINDILGADAGDRLLGSAALRLQECLPEGARCGRFAGDEFLVVLPRSLREEAPGEIAAAINAAFRCPFEHGGEEFVISASIGVARYPDGGRTAQQLLKHADAAMSEAKHRGRNTWQMFSPALARRVENSLAIENQLRHALGHGELHLLYQPQVELASGRVVAAEALLRWRHPQRGELQPLEFVQHAESTGDIVAIGAWAIDEACRQLREWRDAGVSLDRVAVNVSYRQLLSESFLDTVLTALRRHGLPGDALELELIERMLIDDTPDTLQTFNTLREVGVTITIDDFGEGYSALNYLRQLPIDGFKISYDFMRRVPASHADAAICEAIIRVGHALGLTMIAEGVETEAQRTFLLRHGMMLGQGHLFSPALDPAAFATHIRALR
jgi:diguanylate cyclase (GGDEF)-like protein